MADPKIKLKRSAVAGKIPTPDQLPLGEVALNTFDGYLYASKNVGVGTTVIAINPFRVGTGTDTYNAYFTAGDVGIGTTNPKAKLEINVGSATTALDIQGSAGQLFSVTNNLTSGSIFSVNDVSGIPSIDVNADGTIQLAPFGSTEYVGIGTTNPSAKLDVTGHVNVSGVVTATSFSGSGSNLTGLTGASAATYGDANATPVIVVDSDGRITGISTVATAGSGGGVSGISSVLGDTSPQLGGDLDLNNNDITGTGNVNITGVVTATSFVGNVTGDLTGDVTGNADTADQVKTQTTTTSANHYLTFVDSNNGSATAETVYTDASLHYNPVTNQFTAPGVNMTILYLDGVEVTSTAAELNILDGVTASASELNILDGVTATTSEVNVLDGATAGLAVASKALVVDSNRDIDNLRRVGIGTDSPTQSLEVSGSKAWFKPNETGADATALSLGKLISSNGSFYDIDVNDATGDNVVQRINRYTGTWRFNRSSPDGEKTTIVFDTNYQNGNNVGIYNTEATHYRVRFQGEDDCYFNNVGNVGIKSTAPSVELDVNGAFSVSGVSTFSSDINIGDKITYTDSSDIVKFGDDAQLRFGDGNDLQIYHNGSYSYIKDTGTGALIINSDSVVIKNAGDTEDIAKFTQNGAVELYYDNSKKFETTGYGVTVSGGAYVSGIATATSFESTVSTGTAPFVVASTTKVTNLNADLLDGKSTANSATGNTVVIRNAAGGFDASDVNFANITASGNLNVSGVSTFQGNVNLLDDDRLRLGSSNDFQIFHDGSASYIKEAGVGNVIHEVTDATIEFKKGGSEHLAKFIPDGAVQLYYDNSKKFETTGAGATVYGTTQTQQLNVTGVSTFASDVSFSDDVKALFGDGSDLEIYHDGGNASYIRDVGTGNLNIDSTGGNIQIRVNTNESAIVAKQDGAVDLYYDNSKKLATTSGGVTVTGTVTADGLSLGDTEYANFGADDDLQIGHVGGSFNNIQGSAELRLQSASQIQLKEHGTSEVFANFIADGAVELFHDAVKKFETTGIGVSVVGVGSTATITGPANLVIDPGTVGDNTGTVYILGDLQVDGTQTVINSTTVSVDDLNITLASGAANASAANGAGITVDGASATLTYASSGDKWVFNKAPYYNSDRLLTTADEGTGNGIDADTVDGIEASSFLRSDAADTASGLLNLSGGINVTGISTFNTTGSSDALIVRYATDVDVSMHFYCESGTAQIADTFTDTTTDKKYIYFNNPNGSNDPGFIMHETSNSETNEGVLHLVPSDDNSTNDYVSIHGTNDADQLRLHTSGLVESVAGQLELKSGSGGIYLNDDVGIGTHNLASGAKLDVRGGSLNVSNSEAGADYGHIKHNDNYHAVILRGFSSDTSGTPSATNQMSFVEYGGIFNFYKTNGTDNNNFVRFREDSDSWINTSGNVGVGTNNPEAKFVVSSSGNNGLELDPENSTGTNRILSYNRKSGQRTKLEFDASEIFVTNNTTEYLRLNSTGLGIGTNSPSSKLNVYSTDLTKVVIEGDGSSTSASSLVIQSNDTGSSFRGHGVFYYDAQSDIEWFSGRPYNGNDAFSVHRKASVTSPGDNTANRDNSLLLINSDGEVGIGTIDPQADLHIESSGPGIRLSDTGNARAFAYLDANAANAIIHADKGNTVSDSRIGFAVDNDEKARISSDGNLGIGNDNPAVALELGKTKSTNQIKLKASDGNVDLRINPAFGNADVASVTVVGAHPLTFHTNNTERIRIESGGDVGIGTDNPSQKLNVFNATASSTGGILVQNVTYTANEDRPYLTVGTKGWTGATTNWNTYGFQHRIKSNSGGTPRITVDSSTGELFCINNSGKVGIGTDDPQQKLHIRGNVPLIRYEEADASADNRRWNVGVNGEEFYWQALNDSGSGGGQIFKMTRTDNEITTFEGRNGGNTWFIANNSSKRIGIGTNSPSAKLHISSGTSGDCELILEADTDNNAETDNPRILFRQDGGSDWSAIGNGVNNSTDNNALVLANSVGSGGAIIFQTNTGAGYANATERMRITSTGDIGINESSNINGRLHVQHDALAENILYATRYNDQANDKPIFAVTEATMSGFSDSGLVIGNHNRDIHIGQVFNSSAAVDTSLTTGIRITSTGNVGINTSSPSYQLHVNGSFAATTKSFVIDHPTKEGMKLRYGSLEGPENGVYVRGRLKGNDTIELPDYWTGLVDEETITVNLTPIGRKAPLHSVVDIAENTVIVESANDAIDCFYTVFGERKDVEKLEVEF